jgi:hypothetical protein
VFLVLHCRILAAPVSGVPSLLPVVVHTYHGTSDVVGNLFDASIDERQSVLSLAWMGWYTLFLWARVVGLVTLTSSIVG